VSDAPSQGRQRIDRWLWHARVVRTRSAAASLAASGHIRINGNRIDAASRPVRPGDVLTIALDRRVRVLRVLSFSERRGPAAVTPGLYEDLDAEPAAVKQTGAFEAAVRMPGTGRPTKHERRAIDRLTMRTSGEH
jgi:ribosome-associated heat shock protein Hsp15